jgi:tetratricopeptide (TPR) repeat protein
MVNVIDQTVDLYDKSLKHVSSIALEEDPSLPASQTADDSSGVTSSNPQSGGKLQHERVRELAKTGSDLYDNGKLEEAAECYRKALELCPYSKVALYTLGVITGQLKRYEESRSAFNRLVLLLEDAENGVDPTILASAHHGVGAALLGLWSATCPDEPPLELVKEGELEFRRAVALNPKYVEAWVGLGIVLHILERLDDAEAAFRKALESAPNHEIATMLLRSVLEDKLERRLFELGYLSRINKPIRDFTPYEDRTLLKVEGKPLSEIIIEERR